MITFFENLFEKLYDYYYLFCIFIYQLCGVKPIDMTPAGGNRPIHLEDIFHVALADIVIMALLSLFCVGAFAILKPLEKKATAELNKLIDELNEE